MSLSGGPAAARPRAARSALALLAAALLALGHSAPAAAQSVTVLTHTSFAVSRDVVAAFEARTGIDVRFVTAGDAGSTVNRAILTRARPIADVIFGIDEGLLPRALAADLLEPYESPYTWRVDPAYRPAAYEGLVTPVDAGFVTFNLDLAWFEREGLPLPTSLADLADERYRGLTVVTDPATSSPGLAFVLGTIGTFGPAWLDYWEALRDNGLAVRAGWSDAYYTTFSRYGGDRPIVLSYASSPAAEVIFAEPPTDVAPTANLRCFGCSVRQVEAAGVLRGAANPEAARTFIDFLLSDAFQADVPEQMFVYPVVEDVPLPEAFGDHAEVPRGDEVAPLPDDLAPERVETWITQWTEVVVHGRAPAQVR